MTEQHEQHWSEIGPAELAAVEGGVVSNIVNNLLDPLDHMNAKAWFVDG